MDHLPLDATVALEIVTVPEVFGGEGRVARLKITIERTLEPLVIHRHRIWQTYQHMNVYLYVC